jgi:hypothetical protein
MPVNPDSARDSGYFIYLVTVELGYEQGSPKYNQFEPLIRAMENSKACIEGKIMEGAAQPEQRSP